MTKTRILLLALLGGALLATAACHAEAATLDATPATLQGALGKLQAGDVLQLAPGVYSGFTTKYVKAWDLARPIIVTSADPGAPATITDFTVQGAQGLIFRDLRLNATNPVPRSYGFIFAGSQGLGFERVTVHGSLDGDPSNDPFGLQLRGCADIWVRDSVFTELNRGLLVGTTERVRVTGNRFHLLRSDGMDFAQVKDVEITDNHIRDIYRAPTDHPDAIQFWTSGTTAPSSDVLIARNLIERGVGGAMQGIFIRDELGLPYERLTIADNLVVGTGWNALRIVGNATKPTREITIRGNELITFDALEGVPAKELLTYILIQNVDGAVAEGNRAAQMSFDKVTGLTNAGNTITKPVKDRGRAATTAWIAARKPAAQRISELEEALAVAEAAAASLGQVNQELAAQRADLQAQREALAGRLAAIAALATRTQP